MIGTFASTAPHISAKAEELFSIGGVPITNSQLLGLVGLTILVWVLFRTRAVVLGRKQPNFMTRLVLWTFEGLYGTVRQVIPDETWARRVAPVAITIFFFVIAQYWLGILPIVGPITIHGVPMFRAFVADLNTTFALAIITIVTAQIYAFKYMGFKGNMGRYFYNPFKDPIMAFVGILELVAEFSRLLGLSFRLFGNVLAGEVLLIMIAYLTQYLSPIALQPFYLFELFIGGIQAYIFFMLTTVFISLGLSHHGEEVHDDDHSPAVQKLAENDV
ncbi:F0F1 ATP synthase subunit A [Candidatus Saccharibacteria bacterium]|nr:F0F1 ATP synthase subunit A [Candidatus Saccharibacteria bacterium]